MLESRNPLVFAYAQTLMQHAEDNPTLKPQQLLPLVKETLTDDGLSAGQIESLHEYFEKNPIVVRRGAVLNPAFLESRTQKRLHYFLVDARYASYHHLRGILEQAEGELSHFSIYGPADRLIRLWGDDTEASNLMDSLQRASFDPIDIRIEAIERFYGYDLEQRRYHFNRVPIDRTVVNKLVADYWTPEVTDEERKRLEEQNVVLGPAVIEDLRLTGRLKAYVGVNFVRNVPPNIARDYSAYLKTKDLVNRSVRNIFRCDGIQYDYFLQIVCKSPVELDHVTEQLNESFRGGSGIESSTFIVAAANEHLPKYVTTRTLAMDVSTQLQDEHATFLRQLEEEHITPLARALRNSYLDLSQEKRLFILQAIQSFDEHRLERFTFVKEDDSTRDFISSYVRAYLSRSINQMVGTATTLGSIVESASKQALEEALTWFYPAHNLAVAQNDLGLPGARPEKFTLGQVEDTFQRLKKDKRYRRLNLELGDFFLQEFESFRHFRNRAAHNHLQDLLRADFDAGAQQLRDAYHRAFWLLQHIQQEFFQKDHLQDAYYVLIDEQASAGETAELREALAADIISSRDDILAGLAAVEKKDRRRVHALFVQIAKLNNSVESQARLQNKLVDWLLEHREEIENNTSAGDQGRVRRFMDFLQTMGKELPGNILAELIAGILLDLNQPYLSGLLQEILRYMR